MASSHRRKLAPATLLLFLLGLSDMAATGQPLPAGPVPASPEGCWIWEAHILSVIERHKRGGMSEAALGEALSIAYAAYGECVMCATEKEMNENAVSALQRVRLVLSRGRDVAAADQTSSEGPSQPR